MLFASRLEKLPVFDLMFYARLKGEPTPSESADERFPVIHLAVHRA